MREKKTGLTAIIISVLLIAALLGANLALAKRTSGQWEITQYGNPQGLQLMFYTLEDKEGHLIVVDGGWKENAEEVRSVIKEKGNHVDAWILTHPHQDHMVAFMEIYDDPQGIEIDHVYAPQMAPLELCKENASWDEFGTYERFLTMDIPELEYVHTGDSWKVGNLKIDILSAYEDKVDEISNDLLNDGSIMFRVTGEEERMLFCSDVGKSMSKYLVEKYGEDLKSDYLQMGHHGNGGLKKKFYNLVSPKLAFFDAPDWLFYDETGKYTTPKNRRIMENIGSEIRNYRTAPNSIVLK